MAKRIKDLAVVTGSYFKDGLEKRRYENIGVLMQADDGNQFIMIKRFINLAGLPFKDGSESVLVSMFDPRDNNSRGGQAQQSSGGGASDAPQQDLDDEVPFISMDFAHEVKRRRVI